MDESDTQPLINGETGDERTEEDPDDPGEETSGIDRSPEDGLARYRAPLVVDRLKAPPLMLSGSVGMTIACLLVYSLAWVLFFTETNEQYNFRFKSRQGYMASTFADLTWRRSTVTGRVFVTCGLISAFIIQSSWYVSALRNVFTGVERLRFGDKYFFRWSSIRQMVPTAGLMLMVGVSSPPKAVWEESPGYSLIFGVVVHSIGAWGVCVGYILAELQCLRYLQQWSGVRPDERRTSGHGNNGGTQNRCGTGPHLHSMERRLRLSCIMVSSVCAVVFVLCQIVLFFLKRGCPGIHESIRENRFVGGHCDAWVFEGYCVLIDKKTQIGSFYNGTCGKDDVSDDGRLVEIDTVAEVINTASGLIFWLKCTSLLCEFIGTLSFCVSHALIWYYCEERHFHRYWLHDCASIRPHAVKLHAIDTALRAIVEHAPCDSRAPIKESVKWKAFGVVSEKDEEVRDILDEFNIKFASGGRSIPMTVSTIEWDALEQRLEKLRSKYAHSNEVPMSSNGAPSDPPPLESPPPAE